MRLLARSLVAVLPSPFISCGSELPDVEQGRDGELQLLLQAVALLLLPCGPCGPVVRGHPAGRLQPLGEHHAPVTALLGTVAQGRQRTQHHLCAHTSHGQAQPGGGGRLGGEEEGAAAGWLVLHPPPLSLRPG